MGGIYTRRGDSGATSLGDGSRVEKDDVRVEAFGAIDEASCLIGLARAAVTDSDLDGILSFIQQRLYNCTSWLASPQGSASLPPISAEDVTALEAAVDRLEQRVGPLRGFILPAGNEAAARLHVARAVMRRAERRTVTLSRTQPVDSTILAFLNRASDVLFMAARYACGDSECHWDPAAPKP